MIEVNYFGEKMQLNKLIENKHTWWIGGLIGSVIIGLINRNIDSNIIISYLLSILMVVSGSCLAFGIGWWIVDNDIFCQYLRLKSEEKE